VNTLETALSLCMRHALAGTLLVAASAIWADAATACSCAHNPTAQSILGGAAAVFTGVAQTSASAAGGHSITTFTVVEPFKGAASGATMRVLHPSGSSASCGVKFTPGQTYTLAAHRVDSDPGLATSLCSTWMFSPNVGIGADLIRRMRDIRKGGTP
jgi:hypothetical protein